MKKIINEHTFFDDLFSDEIIIIDLGACKGEFSDTMSSEYKVKKSILVEAVGRNFKSISPRENYILYNRAISNESGKNIIFYEDLNSPYNGSFIFNHFNGNAFEIPSITLKEIFEENNLDYVDILKIDIEGAEYDLLLNIDYDILKKIKQITVEFHDFLDIKKNELTEQIIDKFKSFGFKYTTNPYPDSRNVPHYDVCFYK